MIVIGNLIMALAQVVDVLLTVLFYLILVRALISWVSPDPYNSIVQFLYRATDPILEPIRRLIPPFGVDISPLIATLAIMFLQSYLVRTLLELGSRLQ